MNLGDFVSQWNTDAVPLTDNTHILPAKQQYRLRPSSLGKSAYTTAFYRLLNQYGKPHEAINNKRFYGIREDRFKVGHETEARIVAVMREAGLTLDNSVPCELTICGYTVTGTADLVIDDTVIDVKTMTSSMYTGSFVPSTYRTQLGLYAKALKCSGTMLLKYNKDTSELQLLPVDTTGVYERIEIVLGTIQVMDNLSNLEEKIEFIFNAFEVVPPKPQIRLGKPTGKLLTPSDLHMDPLIRDILYQSSVVDGVRYITRTYSVEQIAENIQNTYSE